MNIDSHILAKILEHLHGDGCTFEYVRELTGMNKYEVSRFLVGLGAKKDEGKTNSHRYRLPSLKRRERSNPHVRLLCEGEAVRLLRGD